VPHFASARSPGFFAALGWGVFLGTSWTWCIGMFLPVLLVRDYGVAAWWVFAVPNVIGAAAMGWVLRRPESSAALVRRHAAACAAFSWVTIAFHLFFAGWMVRAMYGDQAYLWLALTAAFAWFTIGYRGGVQLGTAALYYAVSVGLWVAMGRRGDLGLPSVDGSGSAVELAALGVACVFGFGLCPYLDLTFHRARYFAGGRAGLAFGVGFGLFFAAMIVFTLLYAHHLTGDAIVPTTAVMLIAAHVLVQSGFTIAAHARELPWQLTRTNTAGAVLCAAAVVVAFVTFGYGEMGGGELVYRLFMGFYGLVFPAYVWLCVVPTRRGAPLTAGAVAVFAMAVVIAAPAFWLAFVEGRMAWVAPAVGIVLLARLLVPRAESESRAEPESRAAPPAADA
jgi:hypothetical protein